MWRIRRKIKQISGIEFIAIFAGFTKNLEGEHGTKPMFLVLQGTLHPKAIESCPNLYSDAIKNHHNVGRHPFTAPVITIQILGYVTEDGALERIRLINEIFINPTQEIGLYDSSLSVCEDCLR